MDKYADEAKRRWGDTEAYRQSQERVGKMSKKDWEEINKEREELMKELAARMDEEPGSEAVQKLIGRHYEHLRRFYEPSLEIYRELAEMYVEDPRFAAHFDGYRVGLAGFMREAIGVFCGKGEKLNEVLKKGKNR